MLPNRIVLIYDGECFICQHYAAWLDLIKLDITVELVSIHEQTNPWVRACADRQYDLEQGFVLVFGDQWFFGADALRQLATLNQSQTILAQIHNVVFLSVFWSRLFYPVLKTFRRVFLFFSRSH